MWSTAREPHHVVAQLKEFSGSPGFAPFGAHDGTTLINNGQYLGVTSTGPKTGGRSAGSELACEEWSAAKRDDINTALGEKMSSPIRE